MLRASAMRGTAVTQTVMALRDFLNGSFLAARLARIDPEQQLIFLPSLRKAAVQTILHCGQRPRCAASAGLGSNA
jgi:hypothetical protein